MQKSINKIATLTGATFYPVTFKHAASGTKNKRKGYAFEAKVNGLNTEILQVEPVDYSNGDKWLISGQSINTTCFYAKNTADLLKKLPKYLTTK